MRASLVPHSSVFEDLAMNEQELSDLIGRAVGDVDLSDTDVPTIDLYLDQILSLIAERNAASTPRYRDRALTKTMVNNYSKDGLISPIVGKKYSRSQIIEILLVYAMKSTLSIEEIKWTLTGMREESGLVGEDMIDVYHRFLALKNSNRARAGQVVEGMIREDGLSIENDKDLFLALLNVLSLAAYLKEIGREMLSTRFAELIAKEREMMLRAEQDKRVRKAQKKVVKKQAKARKVAASMAKAEARIKELEAEEEKMSASVAKAEAKVKSLGNAEKK